MYLYLLHYFILLDHLKVNYRCHDASPLILQHASPKNEDSLLHNKDNEIIVTLKKINSISKMLSSHLHFNEYLLDLSLFLKFESRSFRHYGGLTEETFGD